MKYITKSELSNYTNALIIDVRMPYEYSNGHINNSINIPLTNILSGIKKYNKDKLIILYCDFGKRSLMAYRLLDSIGYKNLYILKK